jgi:hypothetical protein
MAPESAGPGAVIDACCLIDLLASGQAHAILRAAGFTWHLPLAVEGEVRYLRQHDTEKPGAIVRVPADLSGLVGTGALTRCDSGNEEERERYVHYAAHFRSDGEAICLALAERRGWTLATDDRKAIRVAGQAGLVVVSCPQLVKTWADATKPAQATLKEVLQNVQVLAQFRPNSSMPSCSWWIKQLAKRRPRRRKP